VSQVDQAGQVRRAATTRRTTPSGRDVIALLVFAALSAAVFAWAKWDPYWHKIPTVARSGQLGPSVLGPGREPPAVSWQAGVDFLRTYVLAVWPAVVAGLVTGAGVQTLVPRGWLLRVFNGADPASSGSLAGAGRAVGAALPMMLCTCCSAPVTVGLRRSRVAVRPALAYWLATPLLNPAVLAFAALALSPGWMGLRLGAGALVLVLAAWLAPRRGDEPLALGPRLENGAAAAVEVSPAGFARVLVRMTVRLVPEYLLLVFLLGAFRGALFPMGHDLASWGLAGVIVLAVAGTLLAVPTGGEIAVVAALLAAGAPAWLAAALLVTLPAVSLPSLAMVWTSFPRRVTVATTPVVMAVGLLTSAAALVLPV
jgi:uncharacterized membrane protein YraQ (UPF0718 family)